MNREIKFRVWNTRPKEFEYVDDFYWFEENFYHNNEENNGYILQQFTGLKDCNRKEIYEGDILKDDYGLYIVKFGEFENITSEKFGTGFYVDKISKIKHDTDQYPIYSNTSSKKVIVGNNFQNKELLTNFE